MSTFSFASDVRERARTLSPQPILTEPGAVGVDTSVGDAVQGLIGATSLMVARAAAADRERATINEINNAKSQLTQGITEILSTNDAPTEQAQAVQAQFQSAMSQLKSQGSVQRFMPEATRILSNADKAIQGRVLELGKIEGKRAFDNITPSTRLDEYTEQINSIGSLGDLQKFNLIRDGDKKISNQNLISLSGEALVTDSSSELAHIDDHVRENAKFVGLAKARLEVFGKAAEAAAQNGLVGRTKSLLNQLGNDFAVEQAKILRTAEIRFNDIDHVGRITTALIKGKIESGQRLSTLPKHLNESRANIALQGIPLGGQIDAFKQLGLPLPSSIKDDVRASFDSGDIRGGFAAIQTLREHNPGEAARLRDEIGSKATTIWDEAFRDGSSAQSVVDAMDVLGHPRADEILKEADIIMTTGDEKRKREPVDPVQSVFKTLREGGRFDLSLANTDIETTSKQRGEITSQFRLQLLKQAIRDNVATTDLNTKAVADAAAKQAALTYQQNFDPIHLFNDNNRTHLLPRSLGIEPQNIPRFQQSVSSFETFADRQASDSRVLVNRTFNLGEVTYVPAVSDLGSVVAFMAFDRSRDEFRNTSFDRNAQEFNRVREAFSNTIRPGQLDIYDGVRRRIGESDVAFDAGGAPRVRKIVSIATRQWLIDNGAQPESGQEDEFQIYLDRAMKRAGFKALMTDEVLSGQVQEQ